MEDQHPADGIVDGLIEHVKGLLNGDAIKQAARDAWDRMSGNAQQPSDHDKAIQQMNDQANAQRAQDATKSFIKPDVAAKIRAKASK